MKVNGGIDNAIGEIRRRDDRDLAAEISVKSWIVETERKELLGRTGVEIWNGRR